jgi:hypothetical protein
VISGLALAPAGEQVAPIYLMTVWSLGAFAYATRNLIGIMRLSDLSHWSDRWFYGVAPFAAYVVLGVADVGVLARWPYAVYAVSVSQLALLLIGVRNAWDLATWLAPRRGGS